MINLTESKKCDVCLTIAWWLSNNYANAWRHETTSLVQNWLFGAHKYSWVLKATKITGLWDCARPKNVMKMLCNVNYKSLQRGSLGSLFSSTRRCRNQSNMVATRRTCSSVIETHCFLVNCKLAYRTRIWPCSTARTRHRVNFSLSFGQAM